MRRNVLALAVLVLVLGAVASVAPAVFQTKTSRHAASTAVAERPTQPAVAVPAQVPDALVEAPAKPQVNSTPELASKPTAHPPPAEAPARNWQEDAGPQQLDAIRRRIREAVALAARAKQGDAAARAQIAEALASEVDPRVRAALAGDE